MRPNYSVSDKYSVRTSPEYLPPLGHNQVRPVFLNLLIFLVLPSRRFQETPGGVSSTPQYGTIGGIRPLTGGRAEGGRREENSKPQELFKNARDTTRDT